MEHDAWRCENPECGKEGTGRAPEQCPSCAQSSFQTLKWLCDNCLSDAKRNTIKLYDKFLTGDFGISPNDIQINYSGHRGYHLRVRDPKVFKLDSSGRMGVAHYLTGFGLHSTISADGQLRAIPSGDLHNWQLPSIARKIADAIIEFIKNIEEYQGNERWVRPLEEYREDAIYGLEMNPPRLSGKVRGVGSKSWQEIANRAAAFQGVEIDQPVTTDVHRVIRLVGSLNGKTGFSVNDLTRDELTAFDPFKDAIAFPQGALKINVASRFEVPSFRIGDTRYGPYSNGSTEELPMPVAVFLLCKGMARIE
jgi:DNA primase small subunit